MTELKGEIDTTTCSCRFYYFSLSNRQNNQAITKDIEDFNNKINQLDLINIYRTLTLKATTAECTFFLTFWNVHQDKQYTEQ